MRKLFCALALAASALALPACSTISSVPTSPSQVADSTALDEQLAITAEATYKAARTAIETAVDAGLLKGADAQKAAALDNKAYQAVVAVRAAYRAGNATSYTAAYQDAMSTIADTLALIHK